MAEDSLDTRLREQEREINRVKDAELTRMCIDARRDMEHKLKQERETLRASLEAASRSEREAAVAQVNLAKERELRLAQRSWTEEKERMEREMNRLKAGLEYITDIDCKESRGCWLNYCANAVFVCCFSCVFALV